MLLLEDMSRCWFYHIWKVFMTLIWTLLRFLGLILINVGDKEVIIFIPFIVVELFDHLSFMLLFPVLNLNLLFLLTKKMLLNHSERGFRVHLLIFLDKFLYFFEFPHTQFDIHFQTHLSGLLKFYIIIKNKKLKLPFFFLSNLFVNRRKTISSQLISINIFFLYLPIQNQPVDEVIKNIYIYHIIWD